VNEKKVNIPVITATINPEPPLPTQILKLINMRNKQQHKFKKTRALIDQENYTILAKQVREKIVEYKRQTWTKLVSSFGPRIWSSQSYWREIKNRKKQKSIGTLVLNDQELIKDEDKAEVFRVEFVNKLNENEKYSQSFNSAHKIFVENFIDNNEFESLYTDKSIRLITPTEIEMVIKKLNSKTSSDTSGISNRIIKKLPHNFICYLSILFNKCLVENKLPSGWKTSRIEMVLNKNDEKNIKNYRTIRSTPCLMRLFEKILCNRISDYLKSKNVLIKEQSGFRSQRQAKDNLVFMTQKVLESLGKREKTCCIFFDIETAFDRVWHKGLIFKLVKIGLPYYLVKFIQNYLSNRTFCIKVGSFTTNLEKISCGLPQGAILSPLLLSIYINDIPLLSKSPNNFSLLFGDKLVYLHLFKKIEKESELRINNQLKELNNWMDLWRLKFSLDKCTYSIFSKNFKSGEKGTKGFNKEKLKLFLNNAEIKQDNQPNFLGIRFDKHFTFKNQVIHLKKACAKRLNNIKILTHKSRSLDKQALITIYKILIRSLLDNSLFLFEVLPKTWQKKLQSIQNGALRVIFKKKDDFDAEILHKWAKIEKIETRAVKLTKDYMVNCKLNKNSLHQLLVSNFKSHSKLNPRIKTLLG